MVIWHKRNYNYQRREPFFNLALLSSSHSNPTRPVTAPAKCDKWGSPGQVSKKVTSQPNVLMWVPGSLFCPSLQEELLSHSRLVLPCALDWHPAQFLNNSLIHHLTKTLLCQTLVLKHRKHSCHQGAYTLKEWQKIYTSKLSCTRVRRLIPAGLRLAWAVFAKYLHRMQGTDQQCSFGPLGPRRRQGACAPGRRSASPLSSGRACCSGGDAVKRWAGDQQNIRDPGGLWVGKQCHPRGAPCPWETGRP